MSFELVEIHSIRDRLKEVAFVEVRNFAERDRIGAGPLHFPQGVLLLPNIYFKFNSLIVS